MAPGIRATVEFTDGGRCPVADAASAAGATVEEATATVCTAGESPAVTDVRASSELETQGGLTELFVGGGEAWYRLEHEEGMNCPCACLGRLGVPVSRYTARDGALTLVFHAADYDQLQTAIGALREHHPDVDIKRFVRSPDGDRVRDGVYVDRGRLTARQLEVLRTALDMGYFEQPRRANATAVASALDIAPATFREHLIRAERKLLEDVLEQGPSV